jgi:hypothetical protein
MLGVGLEVHRELLQYYRLWCVHMNIVMFWIKSRVATQDEAEVLRTGLSGSEELIAAVFVSSQARGSYGVVQLRVPNSLRRDNSLYGSPVCYSAHISYRVAAASSSNIPQWLLLASPELRPRKLHASLSARHEPVKSGLSPLPSRCTRFTKLSSYRPSKLFHTFIKLDWITGGQTECICGPLIQTRFTMLLLRTCLRYMDTSSQALRVHACCGVLSVAA